MLEDKDLDSGIPEKVKEFINKKYKRVIAYTKQPFEFKGYDVFEVIIDYRGTGNNHVIYETPSFVLYKNNEIREHENKEVFEIMQLQLENKHK